MRRLAARALRTPYQYTVRGQRAGSCCRAISFLLQQNAAGALPRPLTPASRSQYHSAAASTASVPGARLPTRHYPSLPQERLSLASNPKPTSTPSSQAASDGPQSGAKSPRERRTILQSSMFVRRRTIVALVSALVGLGAWYAYSNKQNGTQGVDPILPLPTGSDAAAAAAASTRTVLVVGADELYTGTVIGEGPLSKSTGTAGEQRVLEMLSPEQASQKLRQNEQSYVVDRGRGVVRYDVVQLASNDPIEDDHAEKIIEITSGNDETKASSDWMFWGVFDGHSGWTTSAKLRQVLISYAARELNDTYRAAARGGPSAALPSLHAVNEAIKRSFVRLDDEIVHQSVQRVFKEESKRVAAELLTPALSGACALLSFYDSHSNLLRVACTGDSRAVLGRRSPESGKWRATPLSVDQTGDNPDEVARLRQEHPGEKDVVRNGRILGGLQPSRAFGDAYYKWTREISDQLKSRFFARTPPPLLKTPPYVTAEPVVTTTKIEPEHGDFVVMATDGLWEMLSNDEVVGLVGQWIESQKAVGRLSYYGNSGANSDAGVFGSIWSRVAGFPASRQTNPHGLPVEAASPSSLGKAGEGTEGQRLPIRQQQYGISQDLNRFVVRDANAATHLVRNALGGKNEDQVSALLTLPAPFSRRYRDDLTVEVIFFGNGPRPAGQGQGSEKPPPPPPPSGLVVPNQEGLGSATSQLRPKL